MAARVGALEPRSSISQEVEQQFVVIEKVNPPSKMRRVFVSSMQQFEQAIQATTQSLNLPLAPAAQERTMVKRNEIATVATALKRTETKKVLALATNNVVLDPRLHLHPLQCLIQSL